MSNNENATTVTFQAISTSSAIGWVAEYVCDDVELLIPVALFVNVTDADGEALSDYNKRMERLNRHNIDEGFTWRIGLLAPLPPPYADLKFMECRAEEVLPIGRAKFRLRKYRYVGEAAYVAHYELYWRNIELLYKRLNDS